MTSKQADELSAFIEKNDGKFQVYLQRSPDSAKYIIRLCEIPNDLTKNGTIEINYFKLTINETKE